LLEDAESLAHPTVALQTAPDPFASTRLCFPHGVQLSEFQGVRSREA
jgi:hypothetical protein